MALRDDLDWMTWREAIHAPGGAEVEFTAHADGAIGFNVTGIHAPGEAVPVARVLLGSAAAREHFDRAYREACQRAGQPLTVAAVDPAAMEQLGQLADLAQDVVTQDEVNRCGWSDDPYHRCRVCYDYAAGRERDHPLKATAP